MLKKKNSKLIWFHAASIGEFKSIIPIIEELNNKNKFRIFNYYNNFKF
jgi:3-deoxy-D-manno-octulosonic-acid transferase